jgi:hypothetical protein
MREVREHGGDVGRGGTKKRGNDQNGVRMRKGIR